MRESILATADVQKEVVLCHVEGPDKGGHPFSLELAVDLRNHKEEPIAALMRGKREGE